MKPNTMYLLQAIGFFLQTINGGLSGLVHDSELTLIIAAAIGAYQFYLGHLGIQITPPNQICQPTQKEKEKQNEQ